MDKRIIDLFLGKRNAKDKTLEAFLKLLGLDLDTTLPLNLLESIYELLLLSTTYTPTANYNPNYSFLMPYIEKYEIEIKENELKRAGIVYRDLLNPYSRAALVNLVIDIAQPEVYCIDIDYSHRLVSNFKKATVKKGICIIEYTDGTTETINNVYEFCSKGRFIYIETLNQKRWEFILQSIRNLRVSHVAYNEFVEMFDLNSQTPFLDLAGKIAKFFGCSVKDLAKLDEFTALNIIGNYLRSINAYTPDRQRRLQYNIFSIIKDNLIFGTISQDFDQLVWRITTETVKGIDRYDSKNSTTSIEITTDKILVTQHIWGNTSEYNTSVGINFQLLSK